MLYSLGIFNLVLLLLHYGVSNIFHVVSLIVEQQNQQLVLKNEGILFRLTINMRL